MKEERGFTPLELSLDKVSYRDAGLREDSNSVRLKKRRFMKSPMGVTLLEILVVLGIMAMISLALWRLLGGGLDIWRAGKERTDVIQQARVAMNRFTREVRETTEISDATSTGIQFKAYLGTTEEKSITYYYRGADKALYRKNITDATGERVMAQNIDNFALTYYSKKTGTIDDFTPETGT
ncbi:type II secretion system protein, partial [bacterium]|nr:type II secretion system protein [bacterium]